LGFAVYDAEGELVESSAPDAPREVVLGYGELLPALEVAVEGLWPGERRSVVLSADQAYGGRRPDAVLEVERNEFPEQVLAGDRFEVDTEVGKTLIFRVLEVTDHAVFVDTNHPLAGQRVRFDLAVLDVRPATDEELRQAAERAELEDKHPGGQLLSPERLLRGPARR
jgi:FKBP-type peptidyl-prolyl cis-trans isomerase SlyD